MTIVYQIKALSLKLKLRFSFIFSRLVTSYSIIIRHTYVFIMYYGDTSVKPFRVIDLDLNINFIKVEP